jgi:elongation factor G
MAGVIDLLTMKAYRFSGEMGMTVTEEEIPADLLEEAKQWRGELIEQVVAHDDVTHGSVSWW